MNNMLHHTLTPGTIAHDQHTKATLRIRYTGEGGKKYAEALRKMLEGWALYAMAPREAFDSLIGDDGVLGDYWRDIGKALIGLLNGPTGGFDPGTIDHNIREAWVDNGFTEDGEDAK